MKKYVYPVILFEVDEGKNWTVLFPDLDIVASGDTVEEAFIEAGDYLQSYLEFAEKMQSKIAAPSTFADTEKLNPKRTILLVGAQTKGTYELTEEEKQYKNFISQFLVSSED